jgi:hypothetical protein
MSLASDFALYVVLSQYKLQLFHFYKAGKGKSVLFINGMKAVLCNVLATTLTHKRCCCKFGSFKILLPIQRCQPVGNSAACRRQAALLLRCHKPRKDVNTAAQLTQRRLLVAIYCPPQLLCSGPHTENFKTVLLCSPQPACPAGRLRFVAKNEHLFQTDPLLSKY